MAFLCGASIGRAEDKAPAEQTARFRVTGLFQPDRVDDLREAIKELPGVTLISVSYDTAEVECRFDPVAAFAGVKQDKWVEQFNNRLRQATNYMFGIRALSDIPREKLKVVEIPILGLDCKGCSLGAYEAVYQLKGVEQATASFKDGILKAWLDPEQADVAPLEAALKQRGVTLKEQ